MNNFFIPIALVCLNYLFMPSVNVMQENDYKESEGKINKQD